MRHAKEFRREARLKSSFFFTALILTMIISLILPLRPTHSAVEKRDLTTFPKFSWSALQTGEYFRGIDKWFADTFPFRDEFFKLNNKIQKLYGFKSIEIHGSITQGDDIPDEFFTG